MINAEDLPSIELACRLRNRTYSDACSYCLELADSKLLAQDETWDKLLAAACAGYVAGVRHERKRQLSEDELTLVKAYRIANDSERRFLLKKIKKEPADAATRQQAYKE